MTSGAAQVHSLHFEKMKSGYDEKKDDISIGAASTSESHAGVDSSGSLSTTTDPSSTAVHPRSRKLSILDLPLRLILLDLPLFIVFAAYIAARTLQTIEKEYLLPQVELLRFTDDKTQRGLTYYRRPGIDEDVMVRDTEEMIVGTDMTTEEITNNMLMHGAQVFPNLLSESTAKEVRDFILKQNKVDDSMIYVLSQQNRWSFGIRVDQHPSIPKALKEVLNKPQLVAALESVVGKDPAVIEFTGITAAYGATTQVWHPDVLTTGSAARYGRNFVPSYSLFIPLQNTSSALGATEICPGSQLIGFNDQESGDYDFCARNGFQASGRSDNWPTGWGALLNQQTFHRGYEHALLGGPDRVLFIVTFAPRPRFGEREVETRQIGLGGSYSLHWSQWGHTLADFRDPENRMQQPWRVLRSLGIYKPKGAKWGWDFVSVSSSRIANEGGYSNYDLKEYIDDGGIKLVPKSLQKFPEGLPDDKLWWTAFLSSILDQCTRILQNAYVGVLAASMIALLFNVIVMKKRSTSYRIKWLVLLHGIVLLGARYAMQRLDDTSWAKNIRAGRLYNVDENHFAPDLPSVLPYRDDILIQDESLKSYHFASYSRVIDVNHPGNRFWQHFLNQAAVRYHGMDSQLQKALCSSLTQRMRESGRAFLIRNRENNWSEAPNDVVDKFCHKELMAISSPILREITKQLDSLAAEARFGYWRETSMNKKHTRVFIESLLERVLRLSEKSGNTVVAIPAVVTPSPPKPRVRRLALYQTKRGRPFERSSKSYWKRESNMSPRVKEGDRVEGVVLDRFDEWYPGTIVEVNAAEYKYRLAYDDGDEMIVCSDCVRPFRPYYVGEIVDCIIEPFNYKCEIIEQVSEREYHVKVFEHSGKEYRTLIHSRSMSRYEGEELGYEIGHRVNARFQFLEPDMFPGTIVERNQDGTFAVRFDDGDFTPRVKSRHMEFLW